jgi:PAS domain S-box-containing protein
LVSKRVTHFAVVNCIARDFVSPILNALNLWNHPRDDLCRQVKVTRAVTHRRKQLMKSLTEARTERHCEPGLSRALEILFAHDLSGRLTLLNEAGQSILGYSCREVCDLSITQLVAPEFADQIRQQLRAATQETPGPVFEVDMMSKDGRRIPMEVSTSVWVDGTATWIQGIAVPSVLRSHNPPHSRLRCLDADFVFGTFNGCQVPIA